MPQSKAQQCWDVCVVRCVQCSEPSSPSVLEVGPDGPPAVVRLFSTPWTARADGGRTGRPTGTGKALCSFVVTFPQLAYSQTWGHDFISLMRYDFANRVMCVNK